MEIRKHEPKPYILRMGANEILNFCLSFDGKGEHPERFLEYIRVKDRDGTKVLFVISDTHNENSLLSKIEFAFRDTSFLNKWDEVIFEGKYFLLETDVLDTDDYPVIRITSKLVDDFNINDVRQEFAALLVELCKLNENNSK